MTRLLLAALVGFLSPTVAASAACLSHQDARRAFPHRHLYWHGSDHCWDISPSREPREPPRDPPRDPPPKGMREAAGPSIIFPGVVFNKTDILDQVPLLMPQPWLSPHDISGWPLLWDIDRQPFTAWDKRVGVE
jgi:hypothetical protein